MATILAHIKVKPGTEAEFEAIARSLWEASHRFEARLLRYEYWRGATARTYYTLLAFEDHRAFIDHQTSNHHEEASPGIGAVVESIQLEWVDPVAGAADLPSTEDQEPAPDADELTRRYRLVFAAVVAEWWQPLRGEHRPGET